MPEQSQAPIYANIPPTQCGRNEFGLLLNTNYVFDEIGNVNWRKMIPPEFLVVNKQAFERRKAKIPDSIEGVEDKDLLILLGGIKFLAKIRGYTTVKHAPIATTPGYCSVRTTIQWIPNFETSGVVEFDSLADASSQNTGGFAKLYLMAIAENRGFVRAVRNFLGINIAGQDEVGSAPEEEASSSGGSPTKFLEDILNRNSIKFENFKNRMIEREVKGADDWQSIQDVPAEQVWEVADIVKQILDAKKKSA